MVTDRLLNSTEVSGHPMVVISIVSHGHNVMVKRLLDQLDKFEDISKLALVFTENIPEKVSIDLSPKWHRALRIENVKPKGFGANHNAAFEATKGWGSEFFLVLNPDVQWVEPVLDLQVALHLDLAAIQIGLSSVTVVSSDCKPEDHARRWPTLWSLVRKLVFGNRGVYSNDEIKVLTHSKDYGDFWTPDWIAGMFMLWNSRLFQVIKGFDERYFMYYEDVDACRRLRQTGAHIAVTSTAKVIHDAQRSSHSNPVYFWWHVQSLMRYLSIFSRRDQ
jgi:N-acetylglucosaminyl-diphospho-decaprenol L-rhamnosyltransferase